MPKYSIRASFVLWSMWEKTNTNRLIQNDQNVDVDWCDPVEFEFEFDIVGLYCTQVDLSTPYKLVIYERTRVWAHANTRYALH